MLELPLAAYALADKLRITKTAGHFADRYTPVHVFEVSGGRNGFAAFVYMCRLNLDLDGGSTTYGYNNSARDVQKNLHPLESWKQGQVPTSTSQKVGLGNACGDPGDGTHGWKNFLDGNRNFYWAGLKSLSRLQNRTLGLVIDDRAELEAGLEQAAQNGKPVPVAKGLGYFPVIQPETGYYISTTSVTVDGVAGPGAAYDPKTYLDSTVVPYAVWANNWDTISIGGQKVQQGDFGLAIENTTGANIGFVYGDSGTKNKVGESSKKLNETLGKGAGYVTFIAFPGSGNGKKLSANPELLIPTKVLMNTMKLRSNASDLATRLAMGRELTAPKASAKMTVEQTRIYKNFMSAFSAWNISG